MRLTHLHLSAPDRDQAWGEHYVRARTLREQERLRQRVDRAERSLEERSRELEDLMDHIPGGMHQCRADAGLTFLGISPSFLKLCGYSREELRTRFRGQLMELISPQDRPHVLRQLAEREKGADLELEYRIQRGDGRTVWLLSRGTVHPGADGQDTIYSVVLDVTRRKHMEEDLRLSLERHQIIMDQTSDVIFEWDIRSDRLHCSSNWEKKFGYVPLRGHLAQHIRSTGNIHPDDREAVLAAMNTLTAGTAYAELELRLRNKLGNYLWCRIRATVQTDAAGVPIKVVGVIADIDADKRHQQQLLDQASKDALTGLLNRSTLQSRVEAHLMDSIGPHALMIMDLDGFKSINDCFGHMCGDAVLSDAAAALRRVFRRGDVLGRIGGDEFAVLLGKMEETRLESAARELIRQVSQITWHGQNVGAGCSIGGCCKGDPSVTYERLYSEADRALYQAKAEGKGRFRLTHLI